jgi:type IV pilus assembly protein PilA
MNRQSFTLIELLIVVAIIGILSAVFMPMYQGYMSSAKSGTVIANHNSVKLIATEAVNICRESGSKQIDFAGKSFECNPSGITKGVVFYANNVSGFKNPHNSSRECCKVKGFPEVGQSIISEIDGLITITSKYLKDGVSKYLLDTVKL